MDSGRVLLLEITLDLPSALSTSGLFFFVGGVGVNHNKLTVANPPLRCVAHSKRENDTKIIISSIIAVKVDKLICLG